MRKNIIILITIFCMAFISIMNVQAYHIHSYAENAVSEKKGVLLCEYSAEGTNDGVQIYYYFKSNESAINYAMWDLFYKTGNIYNSLTATLDAQDTISYGSFYDVFVSASKIYYNSSGKHRSTSDESTFVCPKYAFIDTDWINEVCLGEYGNCGSKFDRPTLSLSSTANTIFNEIQKFAEEDVYDELNSLSLTVKKSITNYDAVIRTRTFGYINRTYFYKGSGYTMPDFIKNYINNVLDVTAKKVEIEDPVTGEVTTTTTENEKYNEYKEQLAEDLQAEVDSGKMTQEEVDKVLENVEKIEKVASTNTGNSGIANEDKSCDAILGSFSVTVNNILKFIQYLGPVLVGVFTVIDFIKAALSGEQDDMKKATRNFSKRIIAAILLFFIPTIVNLIFELLGLTAPSACFK